MRIATFRLTTLLALSLAVLAAAPAAAQPTHEDWLALRTRKQARHHRLPGPATQPGSLTITAIRFFSDPSGQLVGVGEARNHTGGHLTYARLNFTFFDAGRSRARPRVDVCPRRHQHARRRDGCVRNRSRAR